MTEQEKAFRKFSRLKCGALFMSMGTGKTKVALELAQYKMNQKKCDYVAYILPASLKAKGEIEEERMKWTPDMEVHFFSCEGIGSSDKVYFELLKACEKYKVFCIVDESLKIKNSGAKRTRRILNLTDKTAYRLVLNGTPMTKNVLDLWSQMEFLSPQILKMSYYQFKNTFCIYHKKGNRKGFVKGQTNIPYLISLIEPYIYQAELDIEVQKQNKDVYYYVDKHEYEEVKNKYFEQYWNDCDNDLNFEAFSMMLQKFYTGTKEHLEAVKDCINEIEGQTIVFVKFLANIPSDAERYVGEMTDREKQEVIQRFRNNEFKVLYMTYGCGAFGMNLQFCKNIIFADHTWDYATRLQAEGRIYRLGQKEDVTYWNVICDNSGLEDMIIKNNFKKDRQLKKVKDEINSLKDKKKAKELVIECL